MANRLDKIEVVGEFNHLQIREIKEDGTYHRRFINCNEPLGDDEHQEVKDKADEVWTDEIKASHTVKLIEQQKRFNSE